MKVEIKLDPNLKEIRIEIHTNEMNEEVSNLIKQLEIKSENKIIVWKNDKIHILDINEIEAIYSNSGKVYVRANNNEYISKSKLYEIEEQIKLPHFLRISNSEIANFNKIENLDLSITGTIKIKFKTGYSTYASRRNIKKIKEYLKI